METHTYDVTVIGAGPGGYIAAIRAAQCGKRVAIIEREHLGGVCLNWGCIPTKALLHIAEEWEFLLHASEWGFRVEGAQPEWPRIIARSRDAAKKLSGGVAFLLRKHKVRVYDGAARYRSPHRVVVTAADGSETEIQTTWSIIATGARAAGLPGIEPDGDRIITSREALVLPECPRSLTVIGAGAIGLEFAYFYAAFGCEVTVVEYAPRALPGADAEVSAALEKALSRRGIRILTSARVTGVDATPSGTRTTVETSGGETKTLEAERTLVAVGIRPNSAGLGLEDIGVRTDRGFVSTNDDCETSVSCVYAIGDVAGPPALAHAASREALQAVDHLAGHRPEPIDYDTIPACIYCQPQVGMVGLTEEAAREQGRDVKVGRFPFSANGKAIAVGAAVGFIKIVGDAATGEILGAHIIGPEATELIAELALAKAAELTVHDIHHTVHAHPTLSESVMEAAAEWAGEATGI